MQKRRLAGAGYEVSRIGLGTSTWGYGTDDDSAAQLRLYVEAGGNFITTANMYGKDGGSEKIIGRLLSTEYRREDFVVATKAGLVPGKRPAKTDASYAGMLAELEGSLRRLRTDYVDLWQAHVWDYEIPVEETLAALDEAVTSGKARSIGVCNYFGWQLGKAAAIQQLQGKVPLTTVELEYSLVQRSIEREVVPASYDLDMFILPWAPLGRGLLSGKYLDGIPADRADSGFFRWYLEKYATDEKRAKTVQEVLLCARELGVPPVAVALNWVKNRPRVIAPLVGARTVNQLAESLRAEEFVLPLEMRHRLDAVSSKRAPGVLTA